jgi:hypothetical protein
MALGADTTTGSNGGWIGNLQNFAIWDTELTPAEIARVGKI